MLSSRLKAISEESHYLESTQATEQSHKPQDGSQSQSSYCLLGIPAETLTGITAYLEPPSLFSLANVNTALYYHVKDDNTWRWAFATRYLGLGHNIILLRRSQLSWRNEFIARFRLERYAVSLSGVMVSFTDLVIRKWEKSRSTSISHAPVPSVISSIHLMSYQVVLSSCLKYGIVARSLPLTGKVYSGYLSAAANDIGLGGIGNPNVEFAPNASTCSMTSRGSSARVIWGFLDGSVALVLADKVMNPWRITSELKRCRVHEEHQGAVSDSAWSTDGLMAVTGGFDGQVKLWVADPLECIWASEVRFNQALPDPCLRVAIAVTQHQGYKIAAVFNSGKIHLWSGRDTETIRSASADQLGQTQIPCPLQGFERDANHHILPVIAALHIDTGVEGATIILIAYKDQPLFYRIRIGIGNGSVETMGFGDPSFGPISSISPCFASEPGESSLVIAGDTLGCISIYDWRTEPASQEPVRPVVKFEAYEDGAAVTAIAWNGMILLTGSSRGSMHAWDGLTFTHLRSFESHSIRRNRHHLQAEEANDQGVKQIVLDASSDMFIACACDRVLAWKASTEKRVERDTSRHVARRTKSGYAKYLGRSNCCEHCLPLNKLMTCAEQVEMKETIKESRRMVEQENESSKRAFAREKEHQAKLEKLGLTEAEALEYVLMLSREEALGRGVVDTNRAISEEGVFDIDESPRSTDHERIASTSSLYRSPSTSSSSSVSTASDQTWNSYSESPVSYGCYGAANPQGVETSSLPLPSSLSSVMPGTTTPTLAEDEFPPISVSPTSSITSGSRSPSSKSPGKSWSSVASPSQARRSTSGPRRFRPVGAVAVKYAHDGEMDEDLQFAMELSLAEAHSRRDLNNLENS